jgi:glyoxylase-like metal-dependent hydrolase (beta-lactamase superfamily II)
MRTFPVVLAACTLSTLVAPSAQRPDAINAARIALGVDRLSTLRVQGFGGTYAVGQSPSPHEPWPRVQIKTYDAFIDYGTVTMTVDITRESGGIPPRGGAEALNGEQRQIEAVSGGVAWNVAFAPPAPPTTGRSTGPTPTPDADGAQPPATRVTGRGNVPVAQPPSAASANAVERTLQVWITPHGFLRAAAVNKAETRTVTGGTEASFVINGTHRLTGLINGRNEVVWVRTWLANPVLGDMTFETAYSNYQNFDGISLPMRIVQKQGGHPSLDLWLSVAKPNETVDVTTPDTIRAATIRPVRVDVQQIAPGVLYITGGSHHSVALEMRDHVVMIEAPLDEVRSLAVIDKVTEIIPHKPIRFVVNTHHHFDHSGGLRTYAETGATVVTQQANRAYYETAWAAPRTLSPDRLARSNKTAVFETFTDKHVLADEARTLEIYRLVNSPHADTLAMVYLPKEQILIEADAYTPSPTAPTVISPATLNLYENVRRLKLNVVTIAALHGPGLATIKDLTKAAGREETN